MMPKFLPGVKAKRADDSKKVVRVTGLDKATVSVVEQKGPQEKGVLPIGGVGEQGLTISEKIHDGSSPSGRYKSIVQPSQRARQNGKQDTVSCST